jgi:ubiquitin carboxyl-terminal hydrolase 4/11/15
MNTRVLTEVFTSNRYKAQINDDNPLGHGGKLAKEYARLVKDMWCGGYTRVVPRKFKKTIGEFQAQFAGYNQQDSQEFMGFLLDGLHEDLNRVKKKPSVQKIESKGRSDLLIAREAWRRFLLRNDSELVDRIYGQLRSHVTCVNCGKESVTFDPFNCLSLPVPIKNSRPLTVMVQLLPLGTPPTKINIEVR